MNVNNNLNLKNLLKNKVLKKFLKDNNLLRELSNKSLFMVENNNLKIDIDGDGKYDKKINCIFNQEGNITQCNNISDIDNSQENVVNVLNTWLKSKFGDKNLGFSFGDSTSNNTLESSDQTESKNLTSNHYQEPKPTSQQKTTSFNPNDLKNQIENLNLKGIKLEIINNYKPNNS